MASLEDMQRLDAQIRYAEKRAVQRLAEHLRDGVRALPSQSRLALTFLREADTFELWATARNMEPSTWVTLKRMEEELRDLDDGEVE